ncbi:MAG: ABC transporter substrate-binding protein, partial [Deltaproteobacteria bacterium]|nr:ABC transporter substrate-binding protein [Deltaproteobacteria bacterium]
MIKKFEITQANTGMVRFAAVLALFAFWQVLSLFCPVSATCVRAATVAPETAAEEEEEFERARSGPARVDIGDGLPVYGGLTPYLPGSVPGDALVTGAIGKPSTLIRVLGTDASSSEISDKLFVGLLKFDKNLNVVPEAAEYYQVLDDGLRLRFKLRRGIIWSDGNELDLDDVEYTYRMMIDPNTPTAYSGDYKQVKEFRRLPEVDGWTFEVVYEKPFPRALMSWMTDILPRRALAGEDLRKTPQLRNPVTSGPFRLKSWENGVRVTLAANPDYFEGRPNLDG